MARPDTGRPLFHGLPSLSPALLVQMENPCSRVSSSLALLVLVYCLYRNLHAGMELPLHACHDASVERDYLLAMEQGLLRFFPCSKLWVGQETHSSLVVPQEAPTSLLQVAHGSVQLLLAALLFNSIQFNSIQLNSHLFYNGKA